MIFTKRAAIRSEESENYIKLLHQFVRVQQSFNLRVVEISFEVSKYNPRVTFVEFTFELLNEWQTDEISREAYVVPL